MKIEAPTAAEVCARFVLEKQALQLLRNGMAPGKFVEALVANKHYAVAIDFMAHALPTREAVWWGCLCLQHASAGNLSPEDKIACKAAVQWVMQPTEENRAAARAPAEATGPASPSGSLAAAANQTGGTVALPVAPVLFASANSVAMAVKLASVKVDPAKIADTQRLFVELGVGVAEGRFR
jgi:hypothetical protein